MSDTLDKVYGYSIISTNAYTNTENIECDAVYITEEAAKEAGWKKVIEAYAAPYAEWIKAIEDDDVERFSEYDKALARHNALSAAGLESEAPKEEAKRGPLADFETWVRRYASITMYTQEYPIIRK